MIYSESRNGGLGNRIFCLLTAYYFSLMAGRKLKVIWAPNPACGALWSDLFSPNQQLFDVEDLDPSDPKTEEWDAFIQDLNNVWIVHSNTVNNKIRQGKKVYDHQKMKVPEVLNLIEENDDFNIFIQDCQPASFLTETEVLSFFKNLKMSDTVSQRVDTFCSDNNIGDHTAGIHLRTTDFGETHDYEGNYFPQMRNVLAKDPNTNFVVCSDDKEVEDLFKEKFGDKVCSPPKFEYVKKYDEDASWFDGSVAPHGYNVLITRESAIEAMVDIQILSRTGALVGDVSSTFFEVASLFQKAGK